MFVHIITVSALLCLCMLYNLIFRYTSSWYFVLYISCAWFIPSLHHCYICVCINMFVGVIFMFTEICLCTSYNLILGCATYCESNHAYFLYIICYAVFCQSLLTYTHNSGLTYLCLNWFSYALKHIYLFLISQYLIYSFLS